MKNKIKFIVCLLIVACLSLSIFSACDVSRKVEGVEIKFQKKVEKADKMSFDMDLTIQSEESTSSLAVSCYKNGDKYAYTFAEPGNSTIVYRRLFADDCLYEFITNKILLSGFYYVTEDVPYTDETNILYTVRKNIMLATYATLLTAGKKDKVGDADTYRYDFSYSGNSYSLWYDDENLVKIVATFNKTNDDETVTSETYTALFKNYSFGNVATEPFLRPNETTDAIYLESLISFEDWMEIINKFSKRAATWLQ